MPMVNMQIQQKAASMNPVIKEIYRAYFAQDEFASVGLAEDVRLAAALQNRLRHSDELLIDYWSGDCVLSQFYTSDAIKKANLKSAREFVIQYSTSDLL